MLISGSHLAQFGQNKNFPLKFKSYPAWAILKNPTRLREKFKSIVSRSKRKASKSSIQCLLSSIISQKPNAQILRKVKVFIFGPWPISSVLGITSIFLNNSKMSLKNLMNKFWKNIKNSDFGLQYGPVTWFWG